MAAEIVSGIYSIRNKKNGKLYIGSAVNISSRWTKHLSGLRLGKHENCRLQNSWVKHGESEFQFEVIELVADKSKLIAREQFWIDSLLPEYNINPVAGSMLGFRHSAESKMKMSAASSGRAQSEESNRKRSAALLGRKKRPFSDEHRQKLSDAKKGVKRGPMPEEVKRKLSAVKKGRPGQAQSEESRLKKSIAMTGRKRGPISDAHRLAISVAHKKIQERKRIERERVANT